MTVVCYEYCPDEESTIIVLFEKLGCSWHSGDAFPQFDQPHGMFVTPLVMKLTEL